ncbi:MAG: AAA family ATPase [Alphaproteobacteria bacterium]|nr:AAA family ATPase [Alphaproteobacteria bacterium]
MTKIADWLSTIGLAKHIETFRENDIDFDVLSELSEPELQRLGLSLGDRKRLLRAVADRPAAQIPAAQIQASPSEEKPAQVRPLAERRQLTVLFADLADSTSLSQLLDPEDLRDVMRGYHQAVADVIRDTGGFVAKFMGDGVLAYFGYPQASEDAAERTVRAGLQILLAVKALPRVRDRELAARVGVATGPVVVGDIVGDDIAREVNVVGETPNLAARLLSLGEKNSVVISRATRRMIGDLFVLEALPAQSVKGIAEPVVAFVVTQERLGLSRFEAIRREQHSRFVGRGQEVGLLLDRWDQSKAGDGQLVLLSGEAGIGKSRITDTMLQSIMADPHHRIRYQCTPQHTNSPFYPVIGHVAHAAGIQADDNDATREARIRAVLPNVTEDQARLIATLVGVSRPSSVSSADLSPARARELTLDAFVMHIEALSRQRPVMLIVEDAHWIDPTTEELVSRLVAKASAQRLLIVVTHRPEYSAPWSAASVATQVALNRLSRSHAGVLLESLAGTKTVPPQAVEHIITRTDGVPLYVEELFHALRDSGALRETETAYELVKPLEGTSVPASLQDSLMARLDRLAPAKAVAQLGAAIGREFDHSLLAAISGLEPATLGAGLEQLLGANLLFSRGVPPDATYTFKHALVQDAAYESMLRQRRQVVHGQIAQVLADPRLQTRPELLAHHFDAAGREVDAAIWLEAAGDGAAKTGAAQEAIRFWRRTLDLLERAKLDRELQRRQITIQHKLVTALQQVEGFGSPAALALSDKTLGQARELDDIELYVRTCVSNSSSLFALVHFQRCLDQLARVSDTELQTVSALARTHYFCIRGIVYFHLGRLSEARRDLATVTLLDGLPPIHDSSFGGGDVRVVARSYLARAVNILGQPDQADRIATEAVTIARNIGHPFSIAWALQALAGLKRYRGDFGASTLLLDEAVDICERYGYMARLGGCLSARGQARIALGEVQMGLDEIERGQELWRRFGGKFSTESRLADLADMLARSGHNQLARAYLDQAKAYYLADPERTAYADYLRMEGVISVADGDHVAAYAKLRAAIEFAESQGSRFFLLRAGRDLANLLARDRDSDGARKILEPILGSFSEGFDMLDFVEAKAILDNLR